MNSTEEGKKPARNALLTAVLLIIGVFFLIEGLIAGSGFLGPLTLAILLSMVLIPLAQKLEFWGMSRPMSTFTSVMITFLSVAVVVGLLIMQVNSIAKDWNQVKENVRPAIEEIQAKIQSATGATPDQQTSFLENNVPFLESKKKKSKEEDEEDDDESEIAGTGVDEDKDSDGGGQMDNVTGVLMGFFTGVGNFLLVFVYVFFMLLYRRKLKLSFLKFFSEHRREEAKTVMHEAIKVAEQYLVGRLLLILFLAIIYGTGFAILGLKSAIFIAVFAALLSLIPYIGNIIAFFLSLVMAAFTGGDFGMFVGILIIYSIAQFVESYILEPYLVGDKVDLNPLFTILVVVVGGAVWGAMGMIISIPVFAIIKIISDHIPDLHPIGYTLGIEDTGEGDDNALTRMVKKLKEKMLRKRSGM